MTAIFDNLFLYKSENVQLTYIQQYHYKLLLLGLLL